MQTGIGDGNLVARICDLLSLRSLFSFPLYFLYILHHLFYLFNMLLNAHKATTVPVHIPTLLTSLQIQY